MNGGKRRPGPAPMLMTGPLAPHEMAVRTSMTQAGYAPSSVLEAARAMRRLSEWMSERNLTVGELTPLVVDDFLADRRSRCCTAAASRRWISASCALCTGRAWFPKRSRWLRPAAALLGRIGPEGYATSRGTGIEPEAAAAAAPIYDSTGRRIAAVSIIGPSFRMPEESLVRSAQAVARHAQLMSAQLGYPGSVTSGPDPR